MQRLGKSKPRPSSGGKAQSRQGKGGRTSSPASVGNRDAPPKPRAGVTRTFREEEAIPRVLVESMREGALILATDGTITYCNRRFPEIVKASHEKVRGAPIFDFIAPGEEAKFNALFLGSQKKSTGLEIKLYARDASMVPAYLSLTPLVTEGVLALYGLVTDLSEQKRNEAIIAAERLSRMVLEQVGEAIIVCDVRGVIIRASLMAHWICGKNPLLKPFDEVIPLQRMSGQDGQIRVLPIAEALKGESLQGAEVRFKRQDGKVFDLLLSTGCLANELDEPLGCVVTLADITERKQMEEDLRRAHEGLEVEVGKRTRDLTRRMRELNCLYAVSTLLNNFRIAEEKTLQEVVDVIPSGWPYPEKANVRIVVEARQFRSPNFRESTRKQRSDIRLQGKIIGFAEVNFPEDGPGTKKGSLEKEETALINTIAAQLENFLERKRAEEALRKSEEQMHRLSSQVMAAQESERKRIASELHDGLQQFLTGIKFKVEGFLQGVRNSGIAADTRVLQEVIPIVQESVREIRKIHTNLRPSMLDDLGIVATISWFCREYEKNHPGIKVERQIEIRDNEIPEPLKMPIYRIVQEAMTNIAKHSRADRVHLSFRKSKGQIELSIQDNGRGFDLQGALFPEKGQTGMGLSSMQGRAEHSGGSFSIESEIGKGTNLRVVWPVLKTDGEMGGSGDGEKR